MNFAVIEDSRSQAEVLKALLKSEGHQVEVFADGGSCIEAMKSRTFDFFVLDWILPDMGGDRVLEHIRATVGWDVPVIFCTSRPDEDAPADILRLGADDYMDKPIRYMEFMARIHALLRHDFGFRRHIPSAQVDRVVLGQLTEMMKGSEDLISSKPPRRLGRRTSSPKPPSNSNSKTWTSSSINSFKWASLKICAPISA